jgi:hypothetical protein
MNSSGPSSERENDFREVVIAWLLAAIMLTGPALLSLGVADSPTYTAFRLALPIYPISSIPRRMEERDAPEMCDSDTPDEGQILQCPYKRVAGLGVGSEDSDEIRECQAS